MAIIRNVVIETVDAGIALVHLEVEKGRITTVGDYRLRDRVLEVRGLQMSAASRAWLKGLEQQAAREVLEFFEDVDSLEISCGCRIDGRGVGTRADAIVVTRCGAGDARIDCPV